MENNPRSTPGATARVGGALGARRGRVEIPAFVSLVGRCRRERASIHAAAYSLLTTRYSLLPRSHASHRR